MKTRDAVLSCTLLAGMLGAVWLAAGRGAKPESSRTVVYDSFGNITQIIEPASSKAYRYDGLDRLVEVRETPVHTHFPSRPACCQAQTVSPDGKVWTYDYSGGSSTKETN